MADATPERWLPIPGHDGLYEVSDRGRVRSYVRSFRQPETPHLLAGYVNLNGYRVTQVSGKVVYVHQLVALAFIGERPDERAEVRHLDGDPANNAVSNLAYGSHAENMQDMRLHGTHGNTRKTHCKRGHAFTADNTIARPNGGRDCLTCRRARDLTRRSRKSVRAN